MSTSASNLEAYWLPYTANRDFKANPRVISGASGHHYTTENGTRLYDTFSGLWTSGIGHCHPKIVEAVQSQVAKLDYCMSFQVTNNKAIELAGRVTSMAPEGIDHCFFTNSGSESVDTALKMALEVANRRQQYTGGTGDWLNNYGRDVAAIVKATESFKVVGQFCAVFWQAATEGILLGVMCVSNMINAGYEVGAKNLSVWHHTANGHATKVDTVVATFAAD